MRGALHHIAARYFLHYLASSLGFGFLLANAEAQFAATQTGVVEGADKREGGEQQLHHRQPTLPLKRMAEQNWIASYQRKKGLAQALNGIGRRLRRPMPLGDALLTLDEAQWRGCEAGFLRFYPQLMGHSVKQLALLRADSGLISPP